MVKEFKHSFESRKLEDQTKTMRQGRPNLRHTSDYRRPCARGLDAILGDRVQSGRQMGVTGTGRGVINSQAMAATLQKNEKQPF
jgi:hypothetical protein